MNTIPKLTPEEVAALSPCDSVAYERAVEAEAGEQGEAKIKAALQVVKEALFACPEDIDAAWRSFLHLRARLVELRLLSK